MEEIMAKSKRAKAERQMQRDDDLGATEALDATFADLLQSQGLAAIMRAKGEKMCGAPATSPLHRPARIPPKLIVPGCYC